MRSKAGTAGLVVLSVAACAGGAEPTANSNDIDQAPQLGLVEELRLGSFDDPEQGFSRVFRADVDRDGNLYAFESSESAIRVYSREGALLRRIGREGEGPGEFSGSVQFGVVGDTIWAINSGLSRISLFTREGELLSAERYVDAQLQVKGRLVTVRPRTMREDGGFLGWASSVRSVGDVEITETRADVPMPLILFDATGVILDTIGWTHRPPPRLVPPADYESDFRVAEVAGRRLMVPSPPSTLPNWYPTTTGYISVEIPHPTPDEGKLMLAWVDLQGDTIHKRDFEYLPRPYAQEDLKSIALQAIGGGGMMGALGGASSDERSPEEMDAAANQLLAEMRFPSHEPGVTLPSVMSDGSLWFRRAYPANETEAHWVLIEPDGDVQGEVSLPANARPLWSDGETVWVSEPDDFDVPWLVRYRIQG